MPLDNKGMERARLLASEIVRINKEKEAERRKKELESSIQAAKELIGAIGEAFGEVNKVVRRCINPIVNAFQSIRTD